MDIPKRILETHNQWPPVIIRAMLGIVIFPHGAQKLLGWFGGPGFWGEMSYFTEVAGLPWIIGFLVIIIEFFGSLLLIAGLLTRINAFSIFVLFVGIILTAHLQYGFFMNWFGDQSGEGFEYHLLVLGMAGALLISGGGKYSADQLIRSWL